MSRSHRTQVATEKCRVAVDRVTLVPGFDVAQFARDSQQAPRAPAQSGTRLRAVIVEHSTEARVADIYWARIGAPSRVPRRTEPDSLLSPACREHCAGFILCRVDGATTLDEILSTCGLPEITALCVICELLDAGLIDLGEPRCAQVPPAMNEESALQGARGSR
jgi:hypothetical protein